jgi:hypothetical protein
VAEEPTVPAKSAPLSATTVQGLLKLTVVGDDVLELPLAAADPWKAIVSAYTDVNSALTPTAIRVNIVFFIVNSFYFFG